MDVRRFRVLRLVAERAWLGLSRGGGCCRACAMRRRRTRWRPTHGRRPTRGNVSVANRLGAAALAGRLSSLPLRLPLAALFGGGGGGDGEDRDGRDE